MNMHSVWRSAALIVGCIALPVFVSLPLFAAAPAGRGPSAESARVIEYWTHERRAAAIPRDLVIDERGQGYLKLPDGRLQPYGLRIVDTGTQSPMAKPGGGGQSDTTPPTVSNLDPLSGATI